MSSLNLSAEKRDEAQKGLCGGSISSADRLAGLLNRSRYAVDVPAESKCRVLVTEEVGQGVDVHAFVDRLGGEEVPQGVVFEVHRQIRYCPADSVEESVLGALAPGLRWLVAHRWPKRMPDTGAPS